MPCSCGATDQRHDCGMAHFAQTTLRSSRSRERLIAALVPDVPEKQASQRRLPMLPAARLPTRTGPDLVVSTARIDRTGRIHERAVLCGLGWAPGHKLAMDTVHNVIVIAPIADHPPLPPRRG